MCFTGRLTRLLNILSGFYEDITIQISDNEQISNIISTLKQQYYEGEQFIEEFKKELINRKYSNKIIKEWLSFL